MNMWNNKNHPFLTILILFFGYSFSFAQGTGQVKGVVTDSLTNQTLIGVNVGLAGTSFGSATDLNGAYNINRVPAGSYTLVASYVGYKSFKTQVQISAGEVLQVNLKLQQETVQGEEVVVSVQAIGQRQAINQQLQSDKIVNVVSEAKIQELPDFNAAQAIGRLPGISTLKSSGEANKVVIRGLAPKYNSIEVDGIKLSATGSSQIGVSSLENTSGSLNNDRSVDLTMVSPYMIKTISVYKSLTPDMNADAIGGTVNMELREAPKKAHYSAMWQQGYTAKSNTYGNYRAVVSGSNRFFHNKLGVYALLNAESYDRNADNMDASYARPDYRPDSTTGYAPVVVRNVSLNRHVETRKRYGGNLILDYKLPNGSIKAVNMFARLNSDYSDYNERLNYSYANSGNIDWSLRTGKNMIDQQMNSLKFDYDFGFLTAKLSASYTSSLNRLANSPYFTFNQTGGIQTNNVKYNEIPDSLTHLVTFYGDTTAVLRDASLFSSRYKERKYIYKADFQIPFNLGTQVSGFFKFGGQFNDQKNTNDQSTPYVQLRGAGGANQTLQREMMTAVSSQFGLTPNSNGLFPASQFTADKSNLYKPFLKDNFGDFFYAANSTILKEIVNFLRNDPRFVNASTSSDPGGYFDGPYQELANDYTYNEDYYAAYAMSRINFHDLMVIGGARYEKVKTKYFAYNARDTRDPKNQYMDPTTSYAGNDFLLPMVQMKYSPLGWMDLRYSYTQTVARPDYSQLSPKFTITQSNQIYAGDTHLKPALAINHDLNVTFHANKLGLLSVGVFYKKVRDFTYSTSYELNDKTEAAGLRSASEFQSEHVSPLNTDQVRVTLHTYANSPYEATIKGVEVDLQTNFWYLPSPLNHTVFGINYSHISSKTRYPYYDLRTEYPPFPQPPYTVFIDSTRGGRLIDQPNDILNSYIGYDYKGFSGRISFIFQGNAVSYIGRFKEQDGFTKDYFRIDFSARQKLPFAGAELFLNITNLNDQNNESAQRSINGFTNVQNYGLTADLGLRIRY